MQDDSQEIQQEIAALEKKADSYYEELKILRNKVKDYQDAFYTYSDHKNFCSVYKGGNGECNCGYNTTVKSLNE